MPLRINLGTGARLDSPHITGKPNAARKEARIVLGIPNGFNWSHRWANMSVERLVREFNDITVIRSRGGGTVYYQRNRLVESAKEHGATHILFCDSDMTFGPESVAKLLSRNLPVVSGCFRQRRKPFDLVAVTLELIGDRYRYMTRDEISASTETEGRLEGCLKVDATGGAFMLIRMDVFDAIRQPYFINREAENPDIVNEFEFVGEDFNFCSRLAEANIPVYIDTTVRIGHMTDAIVTTDDDGEAIILFAPDEH